MNGRKHSIYRMLTTSPRHGLGNTFQLNRYGGTACVRGPIFPTAVNTSIISLRFTFCSITSFRVRLCRPMRYATLTCSIDVIPGYIDRDPSVARFIKFRGLFVQSRNRFLFNYWCDESDMERIHYGISHCFMQLDSRVCMQ